MTSQEVEDIKITVIKPKKGFFNFELRELFKYKELFWSLSVKEIKVRYKQTLIGGLWAILQPLLTMIVFTIFFGQVAKIPSDNIPYAIFSYSGLLLWTYFSNSLALSSQSTIANKQLISRIYFPRLIIPTSSTIVGLIDYAIAFVIIFGLMFYYSFTPSLLIFFVPIILFFTWMLATGMGYWLSALNVKFRDIRYAIPFFIKLMIFLTPVIYPVSMAGDFKWLLSMNPMSGFVETHRAIILGHQAVDWHLLGIAIILTVVIFFSGMIYFNRVERQFADII